MHTASTDVRVLVTHKQPYHLPNSACAQDGFVCTAADNSVWSSTPQQPAGGAPAQPYYTQTPPAPGQLAAPDGKPANAGPPAQPSAASKLIPELVYFIDVVASQILPRCAITAHLHRCTHHVKGMLEEMH